MMHLNYHLIMLITQVYTNKKVDLLQSINNSVAVNAYSKYEIDIGLNLKSD